ncbi:MAG: biotin--[acetyl-CoA-carboxylase] ligase [Eubacteriales bacterium]
MSSAEEVKGYLKEDGWTVYHAAETDSTNEWVKRIAAEGAPDLTVCLADEQTAGKGRLGRAWKSPAGTSVSMSVLLRPDVPPERLSMLTLVMGMAAADGIREVTGLDVKIKWPNDVVIHGKKLCGILTEAGPDVSYIVIGIGINVNMSEFPDELKDKATSMFIETGRKYSRSETAAAVLDAFLRYYRIFSETCDMSHLRDPYQKMLVNINERVRVLDPVKPFDGTALGIDEHGDLLVKKDDGTVTSVYSGEVSVRGIYGYV